MNVRRAEILRLPAPAKLNLMLRVVGRRPDGYHLLQTVFQFIDRCDWISLEARGDGRIVLDQPLPGVAEEEDLTVRSARLLRQKYGSDSLGATIAVEKNLPMGGGLGGGSSDAATVLLGLNTLWGLGRSLDELADLGLQLGADVPVFVRGQAAWAEGVGEHLQPLPDLDEPWYVVLVPPCHVATGAVFSAPGLTRDNKPITIRDFLAGQQDNHCLPVVKSMYPPVADALRDLGELVERPRLTGTGACIFAVCSGEGEAMAVAASLAENRQVFVARGLNRSPLHRQLAIAGFN